jgi:hypothetical protein
MREKVNMSGRGARRAGRRGGRSPQGGRGRGDGSFGIRKRTSVVARLESPAKEAGEGTKVVGEVLML